MQGEFKLHENEDIYWGSQLNKRNSYDLIIVRWRWHPLSMEHPKPVSTNEERYNDIFDSSEHKLAEQVLTYIFVYGL